jgi:hypothetical protein
VVDAGAVERSLAGVCQVDEADRFRADHAEAESGFRSVVDLVVLER